MKKFVVIFIIGITSCTDGYHQEYSNYKEYDASSPRHKSWFPDCVGHDAYNFKSTYAIEYLCAFSKFQYQNNSYYDSVLNSSEYIKIDELEFKKVELNHSGKKPDWFIDLNSLDINKTSFYTKNRWYIVNNFNDKTIYAIISN